MFVGVAEGTTTAGPTTPSLGKGAGPAVSLGFSPELVCGRNMRLVFSVALLSQAILVTEIKSTSQVKELYS